MDFPGQMTKEQIVAQFDAASIALRQAVRGDESPFEALRRIRADRYGHAVRSPFRYASDSDSATPVQRIEDSLVVKVAKARLASHGRQADRIDADALAFARELEHLSAVLHTISYPGLTSFDFIPLAPDQPQTGQTSYAWPELDGTIVTPERTYSKTPPMPTITKSKNSSSVTPYTAAYGWDEGEMESALLGNVPLPTLTAWFAKYSIDKTINNDNLFGDSTRNIPGFFTASGIVSNEVVVGAAIGNAGKWSTKTSAEILFDVQTAYTDYVNAVKGGALVAPMNQTALLPEILLIPVKQYAQIKVKPYSDINPTTVLSVIEQNYGLKVIAVPEMAAAFVDNGGVGGNDAFAIGRIDPMIAGRLVAKPFAEKPAQFRDFTVRINCSTEAGGCVTFKPIGLRLYTKI